VQIKFNFWTEKDGKVQLSKWRVALLQAIAETGSISAAARQMDISYRRAWEKIHDSEENLGVKLIETQTGGLEGGGAWLTPEGERYVRLFQLLDRELEEVARRRFMELFGSTL
jgi:molybdate transport system regulatory protein